MQSIGASSQLALHLDKADIVAMDTRFLTGFNRLLLTFIVNKQAKDLLSKLVLIG